MEQSKLYIAIDFDGTCVTHEYPKIGREIGATPALKWLTELGHKLILHTMRCDGELEDALQWFRERDIPLFGVNHNPAQDGWTKSTKVFAHLYIDDSALGCPLMDPQDGRTRPFVSWSSVLSRLTTMGVIRESKRYWAVMHEIERPMQEIWEEACRTRSERLDGRREER